MKTNFVLFICVTSAMATTARKRDVAEEPTTRLWNNFHDQNGHFVIPFVFAGEYSEEERSTIKAAMEKIAANTCVEFRARTDEKDYIEITNAESEGCGSTVGRFEGKNVLHLESSTVQKCVNPKTVMVMLLHSVGLSGEHMREDRDRYIKVHYENVSDRLLNFFFSIAEISQKYLSVPYDYLSIMHNAKDAYAKPGTITIETLDPAYQDLIGKQTEPSPRDYEKVNVLYQCN